MAETKKYLHNLDVENNKVMNLLLNPLTTAQRTTIGGTLGLSDQSYVCYDTDLDQQYFWDGTQWITVGGGGSVGPGTPTQIAFFDTTSSITSDTNLYWDNVNKRLAIGSNIPAYGLDVNKDVGIRGFVNTGGGQLGTELLTASGWTSTDWTGSFAAGWTHTPGNTTSLLNSLAAVVNSYYVVNCIVSGDTSFAINYITFGGVTSNSIVGDGTYNFYLKATSTASLVFLPDLFFDGTVTLSVKLITQATSSNVIFKNSSNVTTNEIRISQQTANVFIGTSAGARHISGSGNVFLGNNTGQNDLSGVDNVFIGSFTGTANATGTQQVFIGSAAGNSMTIGNGTVIIGAYAGRFYGTGVTPLKSAINSIYLGSNTRASADGNTNEIVIGSDSSYVLGLGSNTTRIGSTNTISTYLAGRLLTGSISDDLAYQLQLTNSQYFARFTTSAGTNTNAITFGKSTSSAIALHGSSAERKLLIGDGPTGYANFTSYNSNVIQFTHSIALGGTLPTSLTLFTPNFIFSTGTNTHTINDIQPVINLTGGTNTLRGYYYHPNVISGSASPNTHIAFENTIGDIIHGNLAGGGTQMVTVDNTGKLGATTIPTGGGGLLHGIAAGTDTYTVTIAGAPTSYSEGDAYIIRFTNGNTTGCTLNINGIGAVPLYRNNDGVLIGGDITAGGDMLCVYDTSIPAFRVIGTSPNMLFSYVTNDDSVTITKGQVVYAFGGTGDRMTVKLASNVGDATSARTVGLVVSTSIAANQKGLIMIQGLLDGLSILPTATWNDGDPVYLGATPGSITKVKPYAPAHLVYIGTVTTASNGSAGRMYVKIQNGYELDELHNVQAQSPTYKDTLWYDNTVSPAQWKTASISTILGYTPQAALTLTTTGTSGAATLIANTLNIPQYAGATVGGVSGNIQYNNGTTFAGSNNLFWDATNNKLGIGTAAPTSFIDGVSTATSGSAYSLVHTQTALNAGDVGDACLKLDYNISGSGAGTELVTRTLNLYSKNSWITGTVSNMRVFNLSTQTIASSNTTQLDQLYIENVTGGTVTNFRAIHIANSQGTSQGGLVMAQLTGTNRAGVSIGSSTLPSGVWSIYSSTSDKSYHAGNFLLNTTTDAGYKLDVNGTARALTYLHSQQIIGYINAAPIATFTYKNTNAGGNNTPQAAFGDFRTSITGLNTFAFRDAEGLVFNTTNTSSTPISRAAIQAFATNNTAGSESGDLAFYTQSAGATMAERVRIYSTGEVTASNLVTAGTQIRGGVGGNSSTRYKITNAAVFLTPFIVAYATPTTGAVTPLIDASNQYVLAGTNASGVNIARAGMQITNLGNTAGAESGDLIFLTQSSGTAMSEKMRIFAAGNVGIGTGGTNAGYKLDVVGITKTSTGLVVGVEQGTYVTNGSHKMQIVATGGATPLMITGGSGSIEIWKDTTPTKAAAFGMATPGLAITNDFVFSAYTGSGWFETIRITNAGGLTLNATNTAAGTTGNQTINKASGTVNIAAAGTTVTVTNSLVSATSIVYAVIRTNDATAVIKNVVPGAGSFVINLNAATTAETSIGFFVIN